MNPIYALIQRPWLRFFAPDKGGETGNSTNTDDAPVAPKNLAEAKAQLAEAREQIATTTAALDEATGKATADLAALQAKHDKLSAQFDELTAAAKVHKEDLAKATAGLGKANTDLATANSTIEAHTADIARMEALCEVKGIDPKSAVRTEPEGGAAKTMSQADFDKLSHPERNAFFRAGGKLK